MAVLLNSNALLQSSSLINGAAFSKLSYSRNSNQFCSIKLQRHIPGSGAIKAASSVQHETGTVVTQMQVNPSTALDFTGVHHVGMLCENLERSVEFYQGVLGLELNPDRPNDKLPFKGAWFWVGAEMIHLMELPNPDPVTGRPAYGGRDRHMCVAIKNVEPLKNILDKAGIHYTQSKSGRPAVFTRDPDGNALEFTQA